MRDLSPEANQAWQSLRRHLERSSGFTLVFLSSGYPPALQEIRRRLEEALQLSGSQMEHLALQVGQEWAEPLDAALRDDDERIQSRWPLWLALDAHPSDPSMNRLRDAMLAALNEQRTRMERTFHRPLLIALPKGYLPRVWEIAPDLWTIRGLVTELAAPAVELEAIQFAQPRGLDPVLESTPGATHLPAVAEWRRLAARAKADPEAVSPFVASIAVGAAIEHGALEEASKIAEEGLALARARLAHDPSSARQRDLWAAFDSCGRASRAQGRLEESEDWFSQSISAVRNLLKTDDEDAAMLRGLSVALHNHAVALLQLRRFEEAEQEFAESLAIDRRLVQEGKESPVPLRDLSISLDGMAQAMAVQGRADVAEKMFAESVGIRRRLRREEGETPAALRDLAVSLNHLGQVVLHLDRLEEAEKLFVESLSLARHVLTLQAETPKALLDLSRSLDNLAQVARAQGRLDEAEQAAAESAAVNRRLLELREAARGDLKR